MIAVLPDGSPPPTLADFAWDVVDAADRVVRITRAAAGYSLLVGQVVYLDKIEAIVKLAAEAAERYTAAVQAEQERRTAALARPTYAVGDVVAFRDAGTTTYFTRRLEDRPDWRVLELLRNHRVHVPGDRGGSYVVARHAIRIRAIGPDGELVGPSRVVCQSRVYRVTEEAS
jgi:hypothetical protein